MNKAGGFITLQRQIVDWEWYKDSATKDLFLHLLLMANFTDTRFMGKTIKRGQVVTSLPSLSDETNLSVRQIRTALSHLISTGEVTNKSYTKYRVISIVNYDKYQDNRQTERQTTDRQPTDKRQTSDRQTTDNRQHHNNDNNGNKKNKGTKKPLTGFIAPAPNEVTAYCQSVGLQIDGERFCDYYGSNGWRVGRNPMKDWKAAARNWARKDRPVRADKEVLPAQDYGQRDWSGDQKSAIDAMMAWDPEVDDV